MSSRLRELLKSGAVPGERSDALRQARRAGGGLAALQAEMLREMAASLGRASERLSSSLAQLAEMDARIAGLDGDVEAQNALIDAYHDERVRAEQLLWELSVQREALGLRNQAELSRHYPLPPRRRKRAPTP